MFEVISTFLYVAVVLIAVLLIGLVLVQPSKGGGLGSAFGGIGESVFGAQAMSQLSKVTVVLLSLFFVLTLILAVMTGHRSKAAVSAESSLLLKQEAKAGPAKAKTAPAKADAAKAAPNLPCFEIDGAIMVAADSSMAFIKLYGPEGEPGEEELKEILRTASRYNFIGGEYEKEEISLMKMYELYK